MHVFLTNRSLEEAASARVILADRVIVKVDSVEVLTGPHAKAANSFEQPDVIRTRSLTDVRIIEGEATLLLPPLSVAAATLRLG